jgi:hypothetical protein
MFSNLLKFILGFFLAIAVLIASGATVALYFVNRTAIPPTRPLFANDNTSVKAKNLKATNVKATPTPKSQASPSPSPSPTPTESAKALPDGAYRGRITWPTGLRLRAEPTQDAQRVGGAAANQTVIILEESSDKVWQKIRVEDSGQEGWVKAANTQRIDEQQETQEPEKRQPTEEPEQQQ